MKQYFKQLDGLRFIAVLMVMIAHFLQWQVSNVIVVNIPFVYGVTLFFVISGFLITRILLQNQEKEVLRVLKTFYIRRVFRIFPVYYLTIIILAIINYQMVRELFWWLITYTINIYESGLNSSKIGSLNHFWSLAVEEQFYLIWPLLVLLIPKRFFLKMSISLVILSLLYKFYLAYYTNNWVANDLSLFTNFNSLGIGGILGYLSLYKRDWFKVIGNNMSLVIFGGLAFLDSLFLYLNPDAHVFKQSLFQFFWVLFFAVIITRTVIGWTGFIAVILTNPIIVYLGRISYGIYIFHQMMPDLFYQLNPPGLITNNKYLSFMSYVILAALIASFSWLIVEKPINSMKKRFNY